MEMKLNKPVRKECKRTFFRGHARERFFDVFAQENRVNRKKFWNSGNLGAFLRIHSTITANIDFPKIRRAMFFDFFQKNIQCKHKNYSQQSLFLGECVPHC